MQDQYNLSSVMIIKRKPRKLPSLRRHLLRALIITSIIAGIIFFVTKMLSNPQDAIAKGYVGVDPVPLPPSSDTLDGAAGALPDLLMSDVPLGSNPTESQRVRNNVDALGNPINGSGGTTEDNLAGSQPLTLPANTTVPQTRGPKTILIDGKPLDGSAPVSSPLLRAPLPGLSRPSPFGPIPQPAADGRKPVTAYARPFSPISGKNTVSLIVGGLGIDNAVTLRAINELPPEVTLSFAAHADGLQSWINQARSSGHEVLIELPMESQNFDASEPGADHTLKTDVSASRNIRNLDWLLSRAQGYFAVTNYNGDVLTKRADILAPIFTHLSDAGLGLIFDGSNAAQTLPALSASIGLPYTQAYTLIDNINESSAIKTEFLRLEAQATTGRTPIGFGFAYAGTIDQIKSWVSDHADKNLQLAPASYALSRAR